MSVDRAYGCDQPHLEDMNGSSSGQKGQTDDHNPQPQPQPTQCLNNIVTSKRRLPNISASYQGVALPPAQSITPNPSLALDACIARLPTLQLFCISLDCIRILQLVVRTEDRFQLYSPTAATRPRQHPQSHPAAMKSINRFLYGPTPEEKVRGWQQKLRQQERTLDREVLNVGLA